jgi:hypothetical protein
MGLYKICEHKGRMRDRCEHAWWGSFRGIRVSLPKWANRDIRTKAEAQAVLDEMRTAIREGTFDARGLAPREVSPMTFREFADIYKERHAVAKKLSLARTIDWRIRPILESARRKSARTPVRRSRANDPQRAAKVQSFKNPSSTRVSSLDRERFARCPRPNLTNWKT